MKGRRFFSADLERSTTIYVEQLPIEARLYSPFCPFPPKFSHSLNISVFILVLFTFLIKIWIKLQNYAPMVLNSTNKNNLHYELPSHLSSLHLLNIKWKMFSYLFPSMQILRYYTTTSGKSLCCQRMG